MQNYYFQNSTENITTLMVFMKHILKYKNIKNNNSINNKTGSTYILYYLRSIK